MIQITWCSQRTAAYSILSWNQKPAFSFWKGRLVKREHQVRSRFSYLSAFWFCLWTFASTPEGNTFLFWPVVLTSSGFSQKKMDGAKSNKIWKAFVSCGEFVSKQQNIWMLWGMKSERFIVAYTEFLLHEMAIPCWAFSVDSLRRGIGQLKAFWYNTKRKLISAFCMINDNRFIGLHINRIAAMVFCSVTMPPTRESSEFCPEWFIMFPSLLVSSLYHQEMLFVQFPEIHQRSSLRPLEV